MIADIENCAVLSDGHCATHKQPGKDCRKQAVDEWDLLRLERERMRNVVDAACALESILGFDDLNSAYRNRRETMDAFVQAVGEWKAWLPGKASPPPGFAHIIPPPPHFVGNRANLWATGRRPA